ncbi:MAG: class I mannose-6-phosphate isomerase [Prevotella sp.]|nr:class I mannose-6-phosphate isomerase [Prevotella sp.]MBR1525608.1 class I mannose-6-phosphate isomerase [Prevotella sp.]
MQPLFFKPLLKSTLWGGNKIIPFKGLDIRQENVGESWELSGVKGNESVIASGVYERLTISEVIRHEKANLLGHENYERFGDEFPLLIKFIDACQDLSIQVHPDDETARRQGRSRGKTEMWYLMECDKDAHLRSGLKAKITPEEYKAMVADDTICDAIADYAVKEGDCFFLPAGRIHSIGAGCFLAEIQQTSDVTYRIYDFKRRDKDGNMRELHTEEAAESIDYHVEKDYQTHYQNRKNEGVELVRCPYFKTAVYDLDEPMQLDYSELDSFVVLIALDGEAELTDNENNRVTLRAGQTVLYPATTKTIQVEGRIKMLETYV